jgi:hypothetical protein
VREELPEVTLLHDARGERPESAVGIGDLWYEPEIWSLPVSPAARVLYASLCSFLTRGEINRKDLRNALKSCSDAEIAEALEGLVRHNLLAPGGPAHYEVHSVKEFEG